MTVKLLTEHRFKILSLKGECTGSSESTFVKVPHCWKSHVVAQYNVEIDYCKKREKKWKFTPHLVEVALALVLV